MSAVAESFDPDPVTSRILKSVTDLGNTVLAKRAAGELHAIKSRRPPQFHDVEVFRKTMRVLEKHHFRLPVCRFVIDLFDRKVLRRIILEEDDDDDSESGSDMDMPSASQRASNTQTPSGLETRQQPMSDSSDDE